MALDVILLAAHNKWRKSLATNLASVRGGCGQLVLEALGGLEPVDNLVEAQLTLQLILPGLKQASFDPVWVKKVSKKVEAWQVVLGSCLSRVGISAQVVESMIINRGLDLETGVELLDISSVV
jgi:hypothetical protein